MKAFTRKHSKPTGKMKALSDTEIRALPEKLSMFRLMVALHEIIDFPRAFLNLSSSKGEGTDDDMEGGKEKKETNMLFVSFSVLGFEFATEISLNEVKEACLREKSDTQSMSEQDYDSEFSDSQEKMQEAKNESVKEETKDDRRPLPNIPIKKMRVFHFMVPTAAEEVLLKSFLDSQNEINVLCTQYDSAKTIRRIGDASLPILTFKNPHMKKVDMFAVFGLDLGKALLRATIGLERTEEKMSSSAIARATKLYDFGSIVVPEQTYFSPKPLPTVWVDALSASSTATRGDKSDEIWNAETEVVTKDAVGTVNIEIESPEQEREKTATIVVPSTSTGSKGHFPEPTEEVQKQIIPASLSPSLLSPSQTVWSVRVEM